MKKVAKAILTALGILLAIEAVMVLGVNLYVQSAATRARIENGLSEGLKTPVKVGSLSFMPWYGLKLSGITRADPGASADGNSLEVADMKLRFKLWNLLRHDVVIKQLTVDGVHVLWTQTPEGKWQMPGRPPEAAESPAQPESPPEAQTTQELPAAPASAPQRPPPPVAVNLARLRDASFSFYDKNHDPVGVFTGVSVETLYPTDQLVLGYAVVTKAIVQQKFYLEDWKGRFKYTPEELSLFDTSCNVGGGTATGTLDVKIGEQDSPFNLVTKFSDVNLDRLLSDAQVVQLQASGKLSGFVNLQGNSRDSSQAQGNGQIVLTDGFIEKGALFETLNMLLRTDQFRGFQIQDAHADFHVGGGQVVLDDMALKCTALTFTGQGGMTTRGDDLSLKCRITLSTDISRQIPDFLDFGKDPATGARYVDFAIMGDINHPDSNLSQVLGKNLNLKKVENKLDNFLRKWAVGGKKTGPPPPTPAQSATPNP